jgi:hypothetical protein
MIHTYIYIDKVDWRLEDFIILYDLKKNFAEKYDKHSWYRFTAMYLGRKMIQMWCSCKVNFFVKNWWKSPKVGITKLTPGFLNATNEKPRSQLYDSETNIQMCSFKNYLYYFEKHSSLLQRQRCCCSCSNRRGIMASSPPAELWVVRSNPAGVQDGSF